jgi:hypothetical protein
MSGDTVNPSLQTVYAALVAFVMSVTGLPISSVIQGLSNRTAMPLPGFAVIQSINMRRLRTNIDSWAQVSPPPATQTIEQGLELTVQIDLYGPSSGDWAFMVSTLLRDEYGCDALAPSCQPLHADEARMMPLIAGEEQYEERWSVDCRLQVNPVTTIPQQYAKVLDLTLINVPEEFPS